MEGLCGRKKKQCLNQFESKSTFTFLGDCNNEEVNEFEENGAFLNKLEYLDKWSIINIDQTSGNDRFISSYEPIEDPEDPNALALILPNIVSQRPTHTTVKVNLVTSTIKSDEDLSINVDQKSTTTDQTDAKYPLFSSPSSGSAFVRDSITTSTLRSIPTSNYFPTNFSILNHLDTTHSSLLS